MTVTNRMLPGHGSDESSASRGFDWMMPGLWDRAAERVTKSESPAKAPGAGKTPESGPLARLVGPAGESLGTDPFVQSARALRAQMTIALKGDDACHLVCDATSATAVARMRDRAGLRGVPLTVMARDLDEVAQIACLTENEHTLLASVERSVVHVSIRTDSPLTGEVEAGNQLVGLLLPYTPLHRLLLSETGRPLVFAAASVPVSALLAGNAAAIAALKPVADMFLIHDRPITARDADSRRAIDPVNRTGVVSEHAVATG